MNIKNLVLGIAIVILTVLVVVYGISTVYPMPDYDDYCDEADRSALVQTKSQCEFIGGQWNAYDNVDPEEDIVKGYCDRDYYCRQDYEADMEDYFRNVFIVTLPLGIAIIVAGALIFGLEAVGAGLMGGGVITILYGVGGYWRYSADLMKFILSLIGLIAVIGVAYWINKKHKKKRK